MVQPQKPLGGAALCSAPCAGPGQAWAKGRRELGFGFSGAAGEVLGNCRHLGVGECSAGELAEMAEGDREHPGRPRETGGGVAWPARAATGLLSPPRSLQKGFGKPTCCQISALIIFFKIKGIIFVLGTSTSALSLLPSLSLSLCLPHAHVFAALGDFSSAGLCKNRFLPPSCKSREREMLARCWAAG